MHIVELPEVIDFNQNMRLVSLSNKYLEIKMNATSVYY